MRVGQGRTWLAVGCLSVLLLACNADSDNDFPNENGTVPDADTDLEEAVLSRLNAFRTQPRRCGDDDFPAVAPVDWNGPLVRAAQAHSDDMARNNFLGHTGSDGLGPGHRIQAAGYRFSAWAENVAAGQETVEAAMQAWENSPSHCANLMSPNVTEVGVAVAFNRDSDFGSYWTMKLAAPQ
ncbi:hypothetical protein CAI21_18560 [Alkalilimnicola ehrlichii]|uniref:SCP domain-containing protein n=1 Tax=Alkalilimnicola ehrlichii TaxID=351052 RepID=A0A3E0WJ79_9GAMM|nr:CAP domain-containing protein [Alkalilimnicola ehrlichii]RFA25767.1 hypothetical protein CAI21_18560 [Alkalilimnicola ehrlichii]RFA32848.1 hypothetical protein CAL65_18815 [Alkalilimnicola ehrlichii]